MKAFRYDPYPSVNQMELLAGMLGLATRTVINWFHNHRMRIRYKNTANNANNSTTSSAAINGNANKHELATIMQKRHQNKQHVGGAMGGAYRRLNRFDVNNNGVDNDGADDGFVGNGTNQFYDSNNEDDDDGLMDDEDDEDGYCETNEDNMMSVNSDPNQDTVYDEGDEPSRLVYGQANRERNSRQSDYGFGDDDDDDEDDDDDDQENNSNEINSLFIKEADESDEPSSALCTDLQKADDIYHRSNINRTNKRRKPDNPQRFSQHKLDRMGPSKDTIQANFVDSPTANGADGVASVNHIAVN